MINNIDVNERLISGRFFEVLIGARTVPLWQVVSKLGILYTLEAICTIIFVINMNIMWEKVMSSLRAQIFQRVLIQKVKLFLNVVTLFSIY